jgi:hypothetical protein
MFEDESTLDFRLVDIIIIILLLVLVVLLMRLRSTPISSMTSSCSGCALVEVAKVSSDIEPTVDPGPEPNNSNGSSLPAIQNEK